MKFKKKPVIIEAFQYGGDIFNCNGNYYSFLPDWFTKALDEEIAFFEGNELYLKTLEGNHHVSVYDYIIQGIKKELYACKPDIFLETYEKVDD